MATTSSLSFLLLRSSVGRKGIMAVTGALLLVFLIAHLSGNLLLYAGQDAINSYAAGLKSMGALLWMARIGLLSIFVIHLIAAISLNLENRRAREKRYCREHTVKASLPSRTMMMSGLVVLFFILFHLAHFTLFWVHPEFSQLSDSLGRHDVYSMLIYGFSEPLVSILYIFSMLILGMHLYHASTSILQSIGLNYPRLRACAQFWGPMIGYLIILGNISFPIAVQLGLLSLP